MSKKRKNALRTLLIISIVCFVAFLGLIAGVFLFSANNGGLSFVDSLKQLWACCLGSFMFPFAKEHEASVAFATIYEAFGVNPLIFAILNLGLAGLAVILLALGIALTCAKKKPGYLGYIPMLLVLAVISIIGLAYGPWLFVYINNFAAGDTTVPVALAILALLALFFGALAYILILVNYFLGLVFICKKEEQVDDSQTQYVDLDSQPVLEEENPEQEVENSDEVMPDYASDYIPVVEPEPEPEPELEEEAHAIPVEPEPIPEPQNDERNNHVEVNVNNNAPTGNQQPAFDPNSLAALLRDVVRDIVRDEIARNNVNQPKVNETDRNGNQTVTGATFGGPLVVQYFNGGINGVTPTPAPAPAEEKKEEPSPAPAPVEEKKEEPVQEPEPQVEEVKEEPVPSPAPEVVEEVPAPLAPAPVEEKPEKVYERLTFAERLLQSDDELLDLYNELKNEILSYGVKSRISAVGDTFRLHKKMYVRITVAGKSLKLYFALNPDDYKDSKIPVQNAGHKGMYAEIPLVFKVRSGLSVRRCKELIQDCMDKDGLEQGEIGKINWAKELKAELAAGKKDSKDEDDD